MQPQLRRPKPKQTETQENTNVEWRDFKPWDNLRNFKQKTPTVTHSETPTVFLPIGQVKKISMKEDIPEGWRKMKIEEGRTYKEELKSLLESWSIVAFDYGALDGPGYGFNIKENYLEECGEGFIIKPNHDNLIMGEKDSNSKMAKDESE